MVDVATLSHLKTLPDSMWLDYRNVFYGTCTYAVVTRVIDGDTIVCRYLYRDEPIEVHVRLDGINAPEVRGKDSKEAGLRSTRALQAWLGEHDNVVLLKLYGMCNFGRPLGEVFVPMEGYEWSDMRVDRRVKGWQKRVRHERNPFGMDGFETYEPDNMVNVNQRLLHEGHAVPYKC